MKSSSGAHYAGLDHVRAVAAFLVIVWHFAHWLEGQPVPFGKAPLLGPLDEGHLGVSVFMTLSGYLFAKLIGNRRLKYAPFLWNRAIRLLPLLFVTMAIYALRNRVDPLSFAKVLIDGTLFPSLPNGGWSITVESHFYVILPFALFALRRDIRWAFAFLLVSLSFRALLYTSGANIQIYAYLTIIGRIDQFILGIAAYRLGDRVNGRTALAALVALWTFYAWFDWLGGWYNSPLKVLWIFIPTIEGLCVATMISWYDRHPLPNFRLLQKAGDYSYSIYLLHFFVVHQAARFVDRYIMAMPTLYHALPWAVLFFLGMIAVGHVSWKLIEEPILRYRRPYVDRG